MRLCLSGMIVSFCRTHTGSYFPLVPLIVVVTVNGVIFYYFVLMCLILLILYAICISGQLLKPLSYVEFIRFFWIFYIEYYVIYK